MKEATYVIKRPCTCDSVPPAHPALPGTLFSESAPEPRSMKFVIAAFLGLAIGAFFWFDLHTYLTLEAVKANRDRLLIFADGHRAASAASFVAIYCLVTGLSLPGATILTLVGGFLFGGLFGTVLVNIGATAGATLAFLAARYLLREWVEGRFGPSLDPMQKGFAKNAFSYLLTLRLVPLFPFFLVNLVSGLTRVRLSTYVFATALGIIPGSFVYAYAGGQLGAINSVKDIASPGVLIAFVLLGILALVPVGYQRIGSRSDR